MTEGSLRLMCFGYRKWWKPHFFRLFLPDFQRPLPRSLRTSARWTACSSRSRVDLRWPGCKSLKIFSRPAFPSRNAAPTCASICEISPMRFLRTWSAATCTWRQLLNAFQRHKWSEAFDQTANDFVLFRLCLAMRSMEKLQKREAYV